MHKFIILMVVHSSKAEYWEYLIPVYREIVSDVFKTSFRGDYHDRQKHLFVEKMSYLGVKNLKSLVCPLVLLREYSVSEVVSQHITVYVLSYAHELTRSFHIAFGGRQKMMNAVCETGTVFNTGITLFDRVLDNVGTTETLKNIITFEYLSNLIARKHERVKDYSYLTDRPLIQIVVALVHEYFYRCHELFEKSKRTKVWEEHTKSLLTLFLAAVRGIEYSYETHVPTHATYNVVLERALAFSRILALDSFLSPDSDENLFFSDILDIVLDLGKIFVIMDDIKDVPDDIQRGLWSYVTVKAALDHHLQVVEDGKKRDEIEILKDILSTNAVVESLKDMFSFYTNSLTLLEEFISPRRVYPLRHFLEKILIYSLDLKEAEE